MVGFIKHWRCGWMNRDFTTPVCTYRHCRLLMMQSDLRLYSNQYRFVNYYLNPFTLSIHHYESSPSDCSTLLSRSTLIEHRIEYYNYF